MESEADMSMHVGVAVAEADPIKGQLFMVMTVNAETGTGGQMIFGTEPDQAGFTETDLKAFLSAEYKMSNEDIIKSIQTAKSSFP